MKLKKTLCFVLILMFACPFVFAGCESNSEPDLTVKSKNTMDYFGTASTLVIYDDFEKASNHTKLDKVWAEICALLGEIDGQLSVSVETSDVARFNAAAVGEPVAVGTHTLNVVKVALTVNAEFADYDPTVYNLVDLWGFTPRFNSNNYEPSAPYDRERLGKGFPLPDAKYIEGFASLVGLSSVVFDEQNSTLTKTKSVEIDDAVYTQSIDFGGIAKGYAAELVLEILQRYGYQYGFFSCGTSSLVILERFGGTKGAGEEKAWALGVERPRFESENPVDRTFIDIFCKNVSVSTSGDYQHCYFLDGVRYSHIIDPDTGVPVGAGNGYGIAAVTLLGDDAAALDAMTTVLCLMSLDEILELVNGGFDFYIVVTLWTEGKDYCEIVTNLPDGMYKVTDGRFVQKSRFENGKVVYFGDFVPAQSQSEEGLLNSFW